MQWRAMGELPWCAFTHCIASDERMICGLAWLNSMGSGSITSISSVASPASIDGSSASARGPAFRRTPSLLLPA